MWLVIKVASNTVVANKVAYDGYLIDGYLILLATISHYNVTLIIIIVASK